jgi:hypothetical protein
MPTVNVWAPESEFGLDDTAWAPGSVLGCGASVSTASYQTAVVKFSGVGPLWSAAEPACDLRGCRKCVERVRSSQNR